ncbi:RHS repeat-associated core domain-containing protein, partial [Kosakonia sacchari]|uniref:RHS repeat-associated core domain-containing protein n=1 Tax=Kosakonia sacchari TaxID=1158459 RepID=UPI0023E8E432
WAGRWLSADPAGTVDGLNLFRMVRNNPITFFDEEGKEAQRAIIDREGKIQYTHIGSEAYPFDDEQVLYARTIAINIVDEAIKKLSEKKLSSDTKLKIREIFSGASSKGKIKTSRFRDELLARFTAIKKHLSESYILFDPRGSETLPEGARAYVFHDEAKKHIFLTENYMKNLGSINSLQTFIHEASHFSGVERVPGSKYEILYKDRGTQDYYYYGTQEIDETKIQPDYFRLSLNVMKIQNQKMAGKINKLTTGTPTSRMNIALDNADTIGLVAISLGREKIQWKRFKRDIKQIH